MCDIYRGGGNRPPCCSRIRPPKVGGGAVDNYNININYRTPAEILPATRLIYCSRLVILSLQLHD